MVADSQGTTGFSAQVRLWLEVGDRRISVSHATRDFVIVKEPVELPSCEATMVMTVDGERIARRVLLIHGISSTVRETPVVTVESQVPAVR